MSTIAQTLHDLPRYMRNRVVRLVIMLLFCVALLHNGIGGFPV